MESAHDVLRCSRHGRHLSSTEPIDVGYGPEDAIFQPKAHRDLMALASDASLPAREDLIDELT